MPNGHCMSAGTGKTLLARAVANRTDACFIRVIGSELVQKYVGEGARMVRELFQMARSKRACVVFFDEVDAIGGARFDDGAHVHPGHGDDTLLGAERPHLPEWRSRGW